MFTEFEQLREKLIKEKNSTNGLIDTQSVNNFIAIIDDVLANGQKSKYYKDVDPYEAQLSNASQIRAGSIDTKHKKNVKDSIVRQQAVLEALLLHENPTSSKYSYEVDNGNHRQDSSLEAKKQGLLSSNFTYPALVIPADEYKGVMSIMAIVQLLLNEKMPRKNNNANDMKKGMEAYIKTNGYKIEDQNVYDKLLKTFERVHSDADIKTVKGLLTRIRNQTIASNSPVYYAKPNDYKEDFTKAFGGGFVDFGKKTEKGWFLYKGVRYDKCVFQFVSTKGSALDQSLPRNAVHLYENPSDQIIHIFACAEEKGNSSTTLQSRKTYFKKLFDFYRAIDSDKAISPSFIAIVPQNTKSFQARIGNDEIETTPEHRQRYSDWTFITKEELIDTFDVARLNNTDPWKEEWIAKEKVILQQVKKHA